MRTRQMQTYNQPKYKRSMDRTHIQQKNVCEFGTDGNLFLHNNKTSNFRMDEFKCVYIYQEWCGGKKNSTYWKYCKKIYIYLSILCRNRTQNATKALSMSSIIIMHAAEFHLPLVYNCTLAIFSSIKIAFPILIECHFTLFQYFSINSLKKKCRCGKMPLFESPWELLSSQNVLFD